jgi:hypothetical protein
VAEHIGEDYEFKRFSEDEAHPLDMMCLLARVRRGQSCLCREESGRDMIVVDIWLESIHCGVKGLAFAV